MTGLEQWLIDHGGAILTGIAIVGAVMAFQRWALPKMRQLGHLIDDLAGEPARPGVPARPGLMERMKSVEDYAQSLLNRLAERLDRVDHRLERVEARIDKFDTEIEDVKARLTEYRDAANEASRDKAAAWQAIDHAIQADPPPTAPTHD